MNGDSKLIIKQTTEEYEVKREVCISYQQVTIKLANKFEKTHIDHVPCHGNVYANALASLATTLVLPLGASKHVIIGNRDLICPKTVLEAE